MLWYCLQTSSLPEEKCLNKSKINWKNPEKQRLWFTFSLPVTLDVSYIQDRVGVSGTQTQGLVDSIVHLHVSSSARCTHQKPVEETRRATSEVYFRIT